MLIKFTDIIVGEWYKKPTGERLEIIALDEEGQVVEIEYYNGTVEEIAAADWHDLGVMLSEPPNEYNASPDNYSADMGMALEDQHPEAWHENPLDAIFVNKTAFYIQDCKPLAACLLQPFKRHHLAAAI